MDPLNKQMGPHPSVKQIKSQVLKVSIGVLVWTPLTSKWAPSLCKINKIPSAIGIYRSTGMDPLNKQVGPNPSVK